MASAEEGKYQYKWPRPAATADCIVLRDTGKLEVLLIKRGGSPYRGSWAFPGGFVDGMEDLQVAAKRELQEETCLKGIPMLEIGMFGMPGRDPRGHTITAAFLAAVGDELACTVRAADDAAQADWFPIGDSVIPELAFDHANILCAALRKASRGLSFGDSDIVQVFAGGRIAAADLAPGGRIQKELEQGWLAAGAMWAEQVKERGDAASGYMERAVEQLEEAKTVAGKRSAGGTGEKAVAGAGGGAGR